MKNISSEERALKKLKRKKIRLPSKELPALLYEDVLDIIASTKDCCCILSSDTMVVVCKKIRLSVNTVADLSAFQPREHKEDKVYHVIAILQYRDEDEEGDELDVGMLTDIGCKPRKVRTIYQVKRALEDMS
jgi:hypothetical protein